MTNTELITICGAIVTGLGGCGTVLKIVGSQIAGELGGTRKAVEANTSQLLEFVRSAARLEVKLDQAHASSQRTEDAVVGVVEIVEEISGVHEKAPAPGDGWPAPSKTPTPPGGYSIHKRKNTEGR